MLIPSSAFWGQSFVTELTRISAHSAEKFHSKKASVVGNADVVNGASVSDEGNLIPQ
jgi:trehalose 6-phosphate synthase